MPKTFTGKLPESVHSTVRKVKSCRMHCRMLCANSQANSVETRMSSAMRPSGLSTSSASRPSWYWRPAVSQRSTVVRDSHVRQ